MKNSKKKKLSFPGTFWSANTMELFERLAWYGMFLILALYFTGSKDEGALGFSQSQKGLLLGVVSGILYVLPIITGTIADKFGYKKILYVSYSILIIGYLLMGYVKSYGGMWLAFMIVAIGAALFKPIVSATIAKTTNKKTSSIGFGIFYMTVNIGSFIGPLIASHLRNTSWQAVFVMSAISIAINMILVSVFFKEPVKNKTTEKLGVALTKVFRDIYTVLKDLKFIFFLIIIIGFWTMYFQMFFSLPNFIDQWVDTTTLYNFFHNISPKLAEALGTPQGTVNPEIILDFDALAIIVLQLLISTIVMRLKPVISIICGIIVASIGGALTFAFDNAIYVVIALVIFAIGEMASSPKITEYIGRIAPPKNVGLYIGMSFLPVAGGNFLGGIVSGFGYERLSDKYALLAKYLNLKGIHIPPPNGNYDSYWKAACEKLNMNSHELTTLLWNNYHPQNFWYVIAIIGIASALILFLYNLFVIKNKAVKNND
ncbi:MAG: MFS transporter [Bacteroidales bacterium]